MKEPNEYNEVKGKAKRVIKRLKDTCRKNIGQCNYERRLCIDCNLVKKSIKLFGEDLL